MSSNDIPNKCKKSFKGVENFLRRVAFNLGNSPSQTEVKIISCIPIDVTDLQQKIITLEKQLEEAKNVKGQNIPIASLVQAVIPSSKRNSSRHSKPTESFSAVHVEQCESCFLTHYTSSDSLPTKRSQCYCSSDASDKNKGQKSVFGKQKKNKTEKKKPNPCKAHLIYYAQTMNSPFANNLNYIKDKSVTPPADNQAMNSAYLSKMVRKQYTKVPLIQSHSVASEISTPICRDIHQNYSRMPTHDSDVCSCCAGPFLDTDHHFPGRNYQTLPSYLPTLNYIKKTDFYDSNLYDMVPVKDIPTKPKLERPKRKLPTKGVRPQYYFEKNRSRTKIRPNIMNHYARTPTIVNYTRNTPANTYKTNVRLRTSPQHNKRIEQLKPNATSASCSVDCGEVYMKHTFASNKVQKPVKPVTTTSHRNAECLTNNVNDTECQTTTTQSVQIDPEIIEDKRTEDTLNQIKLILQTVLTEVKTNTQLNKHSEGKPTKDAVVQKGTSQGIIPGCSSLLNSYTYSPYNINPYISSQSRHIMSGACCPTIPYPSAKCMQNFPVFIQTPGKHPCGYFYRNQFYPPKTDNIKQAATTATNTDTKEHSKETETLIKEIYKTMALNTDFPNKETTASEDNNLKSTLRVSLSKPLYRPSVLDEGMRKFMKANESKNLQKTTPLNTFNSKLMSNTVSMRSQIVSTTDTEQRLKDHQIEKYLETVNNQKKQKKIQEEQEYEDTSSDITLDNEDVLSSDDDETDIKYRLVEKPTKITEANKKTDQNRKGLFAKILRSVKLFSNKPKKKEEYVEDDETDQESDDNSDDYQTIYSQKMDRSPRYIPHPVRAVRSPYKLKAHSKISYSRHMRDRHQEKNKMSPYMEQEYRRHWNERFHDNHHEYFKHDARDDQRPVYRQNYEARSAFIAPNVNRNPNRPHTYINQASRQRYAQPAINNGEPKLKMTAKGLSWIKKQKLPVKCGPMWKKFVLES